MNDPFNRFNSTFISQVTEDKIEDDEKELDELRLGHATNLSSFEDRNSILSMATKKFGRMDSSYIDTNLQLVDGDHIPPYKKHLDTHLKATKAGWVEDDIDKRDNIDLCACCGCVVDKYEFAVCRSKKLSQLGLCIPLYLQFIKACIYILITIFLTQGLYNSITFAEGNNCYNEINETKETVGTGNFSNTTDSLCQSFIYKTSYLNRNGTLSYNQIQVFLHFVVVGVLIIIFQIYRIKMRNYLLDLDEEQTSASDYTIKVRNYPAPAAGVNVAEDIKQFFEENGLEGKKCKVTKVNLVYDVTEYNKLKQEKDKLIAKKQAMLKYKNEHEKGKLKSEEAYENNKKQLQKCYSEMIQLGYQFEQGDAKMFTGVGFISFSSQEVTQEVVNRWKISSWERIKIKYLKISKRPKEFMQNGKMIEVKIAPEPTDINWDNLNVSLWGKLCKRFLTIILYLALIIGTFSFIFCLVHLENTGYFHHQYALYTVITIISTIIISFNILFSVIIVQITKWEKHTTFTGQQVSTATKLCIAQFINTAIFAYILDYEGDILPENEVVVTQFFILLVNALLPNIIGIFDFPYRYQQLKRRRIDNKLENDECYLTHEQAKFHYTYPTVNLAVNYARILNTMFSTIFFNSLLPMSSFLSFCGLLFSYWVEKWQICTRYSKPRELGKKMSLAMISLLELILTIYTGSIWLFEVRIGKNVHKWQNYVLFGIGVAHLILPTNVVNKLICKKAVRDFDEVSYEEAKQNFPSDYDRVNPATKDKAIFNWIKEHRERRQTWEMQKKKKQEEGSGDSLSSNDGSDTEEFSEDEDNL